MGSFSAAYEGGSFGQLPPWLGIGLWFSLVYCGFGLGAHPRFWEDSFSLGGSFVSTATWREAASHVPSAGPTA
jgi:hypothetical protein